MLTANIQEQNTSEKPYILLIDDSNLARVTIKKVLDKEFSILEAADGEEGWKILARDERIQVVITDAQMPILDGYGLIKRIRQSAVQWIRSIPVIMVTGVEEQSARTRAVEAGVTDFFTKPVYKTQLLAKVHAHVRLDQATRKLHEATTALEEQCAIDPLTQINSRRYFLERGAQDFAYAKRHSQRLSIIGLEIDNYENIIRDFGKNTANNVLIWLAQKIKETLRAEDTLARIRGSMFAIISTNSGRVEAAVLADRVRKITNAAPFVDGQFALPVTISLGVVCMSRDPVQSIDDFLTTAERRIARAFSMGGNHIVASDTPESRLEEMVTELLSNMDEFLRESKASNGSLKPYLIKLAMRAVTILELTNNKLNLGIAEALRFIQAKLNNNKTD